MKVYIIKAEFDAGNGNESAILDATMSKDSAQQLFKKHAKDYINYWSEKEEDVVLKTISQPNSNIHSTIVEYEGYEFYLILTIETKELV